MKYRSWNESYELVKKILDSSEEEKKTPSLITDISLRYWLHGQLSVFRKGSLVNGKYTYNNMNLTAEQAKKIEKLNIVKRNSFDENLAIFKEFVKKFNIYPLPGVYYKNVDLYSWVTQIRCMYNNGELTSDGTYVYKDHNLYKEQVEKLNSANFVWKENHNFDESFELLKKFLEKFERYPKRNEIFEGVNLDSFVSTTRLTRNRGTKQNDGSYYYKKHKLSKAEFDKLEAINFIWDKKEDRFMTTPFNRNFKRDKILSLRNRLEVLLEKQKEKNFKNKEDVIKINNEFYDSLGIGTPYETNISAKILKNEK